jgi:uroporphyrin-III C-methyltransferase/precorrin-2 dehydrogenase/sirohydrochlorin ferrochelatase
VDYFPAFLNLRGQRVLLVGGGNIALRKAELLVRAQALVLVVSPEINDPLQALVLSSGGNCLFETYDTGCLESVKLVIAATNSLALNRQISEEATAAGLLVNVVDQPELCSFIVPSIIDRSPVIVAVSSSGKSPTLARHLRGEIEARLPAAYGKLAEFLGQLRGRVARAGLSELGRRKLWQDTIAGGIAERIFIGDKNGAEKLFESQLENAKNRGSDELGEVYLIGAGPGDPDLLTFKAHRLLLAADYVLHDRLVSPAILDMARRDAVRIYVGKARDQHAVAQEEINQMLVDIARKGHKVVRLKGGDPFIFGRGGEEIDLLAREKIPFQVVPGITAASGCACYSGIPLTHRDYAQSVRFVTGHLKDGSIDLPWDELSVTQQTLVFYMGLSGLALICQKLVDHGSDPLMPAALIEHGTLPEQRVITGTLSDLPERVKLANIQAPTLIIVGEVVKLHSSLRWFGNNTLAEQQPLIGADKE